MANNLTKTKFLSILVLSTLISISANSWLSAWMGLEINLLSFIPLMSDNKLMSTESSLKYFFTQVLASSILLFVVIMLLMNWLKLDTNYFLEMIIFSSLLLKMGAAPFHFWFPSVMEGLSWMSNLILMTWQKIAPLMLSSYIIFKPLIITSIIFSSMVGALGGMNQTSLRKLMAYSSINHLSWMLMAMFNSNLLWMNYFSFYTILIFMMIQMFNLFKISHINQMFSLFFNSKIKKFFLLCNLLSLGGLPPFLGFFPKWMVIQYLTMNNQFILLTLLVLMALITLYYYLRLCYTTFMLNYYESNWTNNSLYYHKNFLIFMLNSTLSFFGFFIITSVYFYL